MEYEEFVQLPAEIMKYIQQKILENFLLGVVRIARQSE